VFAPSTVFLPRAVTLLLLLLLMLLLLNWELLGH
jgi:hypothetical protein